MFIQKFKNNNTDYLRLVKSINKLVNGKPKHTYTVIKNLGPLERLSDGKPNFIERLRTSFKEGKPLLNSLNEYIEDKNQAKRFTLNFIEGERECVPETKCCGHILIEKILEELGIISLIRSYKGLSNYRFDLLGFIRLLIYGRVLNPASKISTFYQKDKYFNDIIPQNENYEYKIYDTLDFLLSMKENIFKRIHTSLVKAGHRQSQLVFYDCTNFFFETELKDSQSADETELRKMGVSKEERKLPIVQMGLFIDNEGIPVCYDVYKGNTLDHQTVQPTMQKFLSKLTFDKFIFVGDRGMYPGNTGYLVNHNKGYILAKSISKTQQAERDWLFDEKDYIANQNKTLKFKSRIIERKTIDENNNIIYIKEKVIAYWSKKFYEREKAENESFLNFIEKFKEHPENFRLNKAQSKNIKRFLKPEAINQKTGEIIRTRNLQYLIDDEKLDSYKNHFGYYQLVTSEIEKTEEEIINIYHGLSRIEDEFRTLKGQLNIRPTFVRTKEHIDAHVLVCFIALMVIRIIQNNICQYKNIKPSCYKWSAGLSAQRIKDALNNWVVAKQPQNLYQMFNFQTDKDLKLIAESFGINLKPSIYTKMELKQIKQLIKFYH